MSVNVIFVCLGNICRSPTAHGVLEKKVIDRGLDELIKVDSAGTGAWHVGERPDSRAADTALKRGYDLSHIRAREFNAEDFSTFDYVLAMDKQNLRDLQNICPSDYPGNLALFLSFSEGRLTEEVPDPYFTSGKSSRNSNSSLDPFEHVLSLVEQASEGLLQHILKQHRL